MNRLNLDFSITSAADREVFIHKYLEQIQFVPNAEELEMMGNYILWGKFDNGKSAVENKDVEIETRHKTWNKKEDESLDALMEQPTFNEATTFLNAPTKIPRQVFSRKTALEQAPDFLKETFRELFHQIDTLDLILNYYDLEHGKRKQEPREELLAQFTFNEAAALQQRASKLNQFKYLKMRHELVELRNLQYTLKDSYAQPMQHALPQIYVEEVVPEFEYNIEVYPLGIMTPDTFMDLVFRSETELHPKKYTDKELATISKYYWEKREREETRNFNAIDLRNPEHLGQLFSFFEELEEQDKNPSTEAMLRTLEYYVGFAQLSEMHREILDLKIHKFTNQQIQQIINPKYNKSYTVNYISTIFRQKIIPTITEAVEYHYNIISNLFFEENFKVCISCGRTLLCDPHNFIRKSRSKDGYNSKCKCCEKLDRRK